MSVRAAEPLGDVLQQLRTTAGAARVQNLVPVHPGLSQLLPEGGLRPGAAYAVTGGALLLSLLAEPSAAGLWCGVVGLPELGAEAARSAGVALDRLALVPQPGERWLSVVAALAEVLPVVAVRPSGRVRDADAARLAARLRERSCVLLACGEWPRVEARLGVAEAEWQGLGDGHGYLFERQAVVTAHTRHSGTPRSTRLLLPSGDGRPAAVELAQPEAARRGAPTARFRAVG